MCSTRTRTQLADYAKSTASATDRPLRPFRRECRFPDTANYHKDSFTTLSNFRHALHRPVDSVAFHGMLLARRSLSA